MRHIGTSLIVLWLRLHAPSTGGLGSILGQGTKIPHASTKPQHRQINKYFKKKRVRHAKPSGVALLVVIYTSINFLVFTLGRYGKEYRVQMTESQSKSSVGIINEDAS